MTYNNRADIVSFNGMRDEGRVPFKVKKEGEKGRLLNKFNCAALLL